MLPKGRRWGTDCCQLNRAQGEPNTPSCSTLLLLRAAGMNWHYCCWEQLEMNCFARVWMTTYSRNLPAETTSQLWILSLTLRLSWTCSVTINPNWVLVFALSPGTKPMQLNNTHVSPAKQLRRQQDGPCYYCGQANHCTAVCPQMLRPRNPVSSLNGWVLCHLYPELTI